MALNVDILSVNELYINGVNILENKRDYIELVGDEKIIIDVPSSTYTKTVPQTGVNLGDLELKTTPLDGKTFDSINNAGGIVVDGVSYEVDSIGAYVQDVNIDTFTIGQSSALKTIDFTTYKWSDVDFGVYSLILNGESSTELSDNGLVYAVNNTKTITSYGNAQLDSTIKKVGSNSAKFNGSTRYEVIYTNDMSLGTGDFTIETWIYLDTTSSYHRGIIQLGTYTAEKFTVKTNPSKMLEIYYAEGWVSLIDDIPITPYVWTHIAVVRKTGVLYVYIDGVLTRTVPFTSSVNTVSGGKTVIGADTNTGNAYYFLGNIDELSVSNIARYVADFTPRTVPYYDYNTIIYFGNDVLTATPPLSNIILMSTTEKVNGTSSYEFKGNNYFTAPSNAKYALGLEDFTIEFNTKVTTLDSTNGATILENRPDATNGAYWSIQMTKDGYIMLYANTTYIFTGTTNQFNKWCNVAITRKDGVMYLYVNGIKEGQYSATSINFTRDSFVVGRNTYFATATGAYLRGFIDDLRITKGFCRYTENFTPSSTPDTGVRAVKSKVHNGTVIASDIEYADYTVNYGTLLDPWVAVEPTITTSGEPFTLIDATVTSINTFTTTETIQMGDIVSADRETFGTVVLSDNGEYMIDTDIFFDGTTEKDLDVSDVNIINFVQDTRASSYANGLRDALLATVNKTIYGHTYNDIIIDAGLGGHFVLGTLYTTGGLNDSDKTTQFQIQLSDDGIEYTTVYENLEDLTSNHAHLMVGTGRFIKIVFLDELDGWGRINTNIVNGKWWNLRVVHPLSTIYKYNVRLSINGKLIVPKYIQWFDNMTINKIVCGKVFINPTTVLKIDSENVAKVELDLWQEVKGVY